VIVYREKHEDILTPGIGVGAADESGLRRTMIAHLNDTTSLGHGKLGQAPLTPCRLRQPASRPVQQDPPHTHVRKAIQPRSGLEGNKRHVTLVHKAATS